jgi:hypothetical protein
MECSPDHFISEKYKTVPSFKLYFLLNSPLCNYAVLPATIKVLKTFLQAILGSLFSSSVALLMMSVTSQKRRPSMLVSVEETGTHQLQPG